MTSSSNLGMRNQLEIINERIDLLEELRVSECDLLLLLHSGLRVKFHQVICNLLKITLSLLERKWFFIPSEWFLGELVSMQGNVVNLDEVSFNPMMKSCSWRLSCFVSTTQLPLPPLKLCQSSNLALFFIFYFIYSNKSLSRSYNNCITWDPMLHASYCIKRVCLFQDWIILVSSIPLYFFLLNTCMFKFLGKFDVFFLSLWLYNQRILWLIGCIKWTKWKRNIKLRLLCFVFLSEFWISYISLQ